MRKRDRLKLYPNHQHLWSTDRPGDLVRCDVCDLEMPRNVVEAYDEPKVERIDLVAAVQVIADSVRRAHEMEETARQIQAIINPADTDIRCTHQDDAGQCLDHQGHLGGHQPPAQEPA